MKLYVSPTSPYARLACIMCLEAGLPDLDIVILDPWQNPPALAAANPAIRVPTLETGDGAVVLTESLLIADYAARHADAPAGLWFADDIERRIGGLCLGIIDAAAAMMAGRMVTSVSVDDPAFDSSPVAGRRRAAMARSLDSLEALLATAGTSVAGRPCLTTFLPAIVVDYLAMRFGDAYATPARPHLARLVAVVSERPAVARTRPLFTQFVPIEA